MEISKEVVAAIIGAVPVVAAPLVAWMLDRRGEAKGIRRLEALEKRVQVIDRLLALDKHLTDERRETLEAELANIAQDLVADRAREHAAGKTAVERLTIVQRLLLLYDQPNRRASIYRGFFWAFLFCAFLGSGSALLTFSNEKPEQSPWPTALFVFLFYFVIALMCRQGAKQQLRRAQMSASRSQKAPP